MKYIVLALALVLGAVGGLWIAGQDGDAQRARAVRSEDQSDVEAVLQTFEAYVRLGNRFDAAFADSYASSAVVHVAIHHPDGKIEHVSITGANILAKREVIIEFSRQKGAQYRYDDVLATKTEHGVRIDARQSSNLYDDVYPYAAVWARDPSGIWKIVEEWAHGPPL